MSTCLCGSPHVTLYAAGYRCPQHTPAAIAGRPEPGQDRYCAPCRCYCGSCPSWDRPLEPITPTVIDNRAIASGKRRSSLTAYRDAQAQIHQLRPGGTP